MGQDNEISRLHDQVVSAMEQGDIVRGWEILIQITQLLFANYDLVNTSNNPNKPAFHKDMQTTMKVMILVFEKQFPQQTVGNTNTLSDNGLFIQNVRSSIDRLDVVDDLISDEELAHLFGEMIDYVTRKYIENLSHMM